MVKRRTPEQAKAAFLAIVAEKEARLADGAVYVDTKTPVFVICADKHVWPVRPDGVLYRDSGICGIYAGNDTATAEPRFWAWMAAIGATPAKGAVYRNARTPVDVICREGHPCRPMPTNVGPDRQGICQVCARRSAAAAEAAFWALVADHDAEPADGAVYVNSGTPVALICVAGHACAPTPDNLKQGRGPCLTCTSQDPVVAEATFWSRVAARGGRRAPGAVYVNSSTKVPLICAAGHDCAPRPDSVNHGQGICDKCAATFGRVYLLLHSAAGVLKVGVASGPVRVRRHVARGYRLIAQWTGVEHDAARAAERSVLTRWRAAGIDAVAAAPRNGRTETAPARHLPATRAQLGLLLGAPTGEPPPEVEPVPIDPGAQRAA